MSQRKDNGPSPRGGGQTVMAFLFGRADMPGVPGQRPSGGQVRRYMVFSFLAAVPCLALACYFFGSAVLTMWAAAFAAAAGVEILFALVRRRPVNGGALVFAALLVLVLPLRPELPTAPAASAPVASMPSGLAAKYSAAALPLWTVALAAAFGTLFGKEVFGGTGHHLFSPVLVGKAFVVFSYPRLVEGAYLGSMLDPRWAGAFAPGDWVLAAGFIGIAGGVAMLLAQPRNIQTLVALLGSAAALAWLLGGGAGSAASTQATRAASAVVALPYGSVPRMLAADGLLFGACFLACDPACGPQTNLGRWLYGLLVGGTAILVRCFSPQTEAMLWAVLLGSVFAPALDRAASALGSGAAKGEAGEGK